MRPRPRLRLKVGLTLRLRPRLRLSRRLRLRLRLRCSGRRPGVWAEGHDDEAGEGLCGPIREEAAEVRLDGVARLLKARLLKARHEFRP